MHYHEYLLGRQPIITDKTNHVRNLSMEDLAFGKVKSTVLMKTMLIINL